MPRKGQDQEPGLRTERAGHTPPSTSPAVISSNCVHTVLAASVTGTDPHLAAHGGLHAFDTFCQVAATDDAKEGIAAFVEKRRPHWGDSGALRWPIGLSTVMMLVLAKSWRDDGHACHYPGAPQTRGVLTKGAAKLSWHYMYLDHQVRLDGATVAPLGGGADQIAAMGGHASAGLWRPRHIGDAAR